MAHLRALYFLSRDILRTAFLENYLRFPLIGSSSIAHTLLIMEIDSILGKLQVILTD